MPDGCELQVWTLNPECIKQGASIDFRVCNRLLRIRVDAISPINHRRKKPGGLFKYFWFSCRFSSRCFPERFDHSHSTSRLRVLLALNLLEGLCIVTGRRSRVGDGDTEHHSYDTRSSLSEKRRAGAGAFF